MSSNYTEELRPAGLATPGKLIKQWDETFGVGGPIKKDRLWYYATYRDEGQHRTIPGIFPNLNAGDPTKWEYSPDTSREARGAESFQLASVRFTVQASERNKFNVHWDGSGPATVPRSLPATRAESSQTESVVGPLGLGGLSATTSPETSGYLRTTVQNRQVTWQSPVTNRLLLEAGLGSYIAAWGPFEAPGNLTRGLVRVTELQARNGAVANFNYRSANWAENWDNPNRWRTSASYVTGAHSMKFGYEGSYLVEDIENHGNDLNLAYQFNGGRPSQLTESLRVFKQKDRVRTAALYVQDQWTRGRMTLQGAVRFDNAKSYSPEQTIGPALINGQTFLATPLHFERTDGVNFKDLSPRGGMALDVFGNGKTALKVNFGKYMDPASNLNGNYSISNPIARIATTASRTWTDNGTGGPGTPASVTSSLSAISPTTRQRRMRRDDPDDVRYVGADDRGDRHEPSQRLGRSSAGLAGRRVGSQQVLPRVSVEIGYLKRWLQNFTATDNLAVQSSDFTPFSITAPVDSRLPDGGGYPVGTLYNVVASGFGRTSNNITRANNFGTQYQSFNGMLVSFSARIRNGLTLQGGVNSGVTVTDSCEIREALPETNPTNPYCHNAPGWVTGMRRSGPTPSRRLTYCLPGRSGAIREPRSRPITTCRSR